MASNSFQQPSRDGRNRLRRIALGGAAAVALGLAIGTPLFGGTPALANPNHFGVNTTEDLPDANLGDGLCKAANSRCSLRAAVQQSNALGGNYIIDVPAGVYSLSRIGDAEDGGAWGDLDITAPVEISGAGPGLVTIDGLHRDRVFDVHSDDVTIHDVTIANGYTSGSNGGCVRIDGGLVLQHSTVKDCAAVDAFGGAIANNRFAVLRDDNIQMGHALSGGAIFNSATMTVSFSQVGNSQAHGEPERDGNFGLGGGILNKGELDLSDSAVFKNEAWQSGGGIATLNTSSTTIVRSAITGNHSFHFGGGIHAPGWLNMLNSTVSDNEAPHAGGVWVWGEGSMIRNSTIAFNRALGTGSSSGYGGGVTGASLDFPVDLSNTIVANNSGSFGAQECWGNFISTGSNMFLGSAAGCDIRGASGDIFETDPRLAPLGYNGGWTLSHALQPGSPARDAGLDWDCLPEDQRGHARPQGSHCDIGALEMSVIAFIPLDPGAIPPFRP